MPVLRSRHRRDALGTAAIIAGTAATALFVARGDQPARDPAAECGALLDRFVELRLTASDAALHARALDERRDVARRQATEPRSTGPSVIRTCAAHLTEASAACAREAQSIDAFERCFP